MDHMQQVPSDEEFEIVDSADAADVAGDSEPDVSGIDESSSAPCNTDANAFLDHGSELAALDDGQISDSNDEESGGDNDGALDEPQASATDNAVTEVSAMRAAPQDLGELPQESAIEDHSNLASGDPLRALGTFDLPEPVRMIVMYEDSTHSSVAIAVLLVIWLACRVDFGVTVPYLVVFLLEFALVTAMCADGILHVHENLYLGKSAPATVENIISPALAKLTTQLEKYGPIKSGCHQIDTTVDFFNVALSGYSGLLMCTNYWRTGKAIFILYLAGKVLQFFSVAGLAVTACIGLFSVPYLFNRYRTDIVLAYDTMERHIGAAQATLASMLPSKMKSD